jgi:hypothetical protein
MINHERQLQDLPYRISVVVSNLTTDLKALKSSSPAPVSTPTPDPLVSSFPLQEAKSVDGIISYRTRKPGRNVHDKGALAITSKSVNKDKPNNPVWNIARVTSGARSDSTQSLPPDVCRPVIVSMA